MSSRAPFVRKHKKASEQSGLCSSHRKNQAGAQRSGSGLGRRSKGAGGWRFFVRKHKKASEQSGLCSDDVAEMERFELSKGF